MNLLAREPVVIAAAIRAVLIAAMAFGLNWSPEQMAAVMGAVEGLLAVIVRSQVTTDPTLLKLDEA